MSSRGRTWISALWLCALAFVACSRATSGGESSKTAAQILADAKNATSSLRSVHVAGTFTKAGFDSIDLSIAQNRGGGSVLVNQQPISVFADQSGVYLKAEPSTWLSLSKSPASEKLGDRWVEFPTASAIFAQFGVDSIQKLVAGALNQDPQSLSKGADTTFHGLAAITLHAANETIYVAERGPPYLLGLQSSGTVTFDQFNAAVVPQPPPTFTPAADLLK